MGESEAERQRRLEEFADKHNRDVAEKQDQGRESGAEKRARENLDHKDRES